MIIKEKFSVTWPRGFWRAINKSSIRRPQTWFWSRPEAVAWAIRGRLTDDVTIQEQSVTRRWLRDAVRWRHVDDVDERRRVVACSSRSETSCQVFMKADFFFLSRLQLRGRLAFVQVQRGTGSKPGATWLIIDERDWRNKNQVLSLLILSIGCGTSNKWYQQLEKKYLVTTLKLFNVHWHKKNNNKNWLLGQRLFKFWFIPARG